MMRRWFSLSLLLSVVWLGAALHAQVPIITTAGGGGANLNGLPALQFPLIGSNAVGVDPAGYLYVAFNNSIYKIDASGNYVKIAGTGTCGFSGDGGPATSAAFCNPSYIITDSAGDFYISDGGNNRVRTINAAGIVTTLVSGLSYPRGLSLDSTGNLYIADVGNQVIRKYDTAGNLTTVAGTVGSCSFNGDGPALATSTLLCNPQAVAVDGGGNLYVVDSGYGRVRKLDSSGNMTTVIGYAYGIQDLRLDPSGSLVLNVSGCCGGWDLYSDNPTYGWGFYNWLGNFGDQVVTFTPPSSTSVSSLAGVYDRYGFNGDGVATSSYLNGPSSIAIDASDNLFVDDSGNYRLRRVDTSGNMTTVAGNGTCCFGGDGFPFSDAIFNTPTAVALDGLGNTYIADRYNQRIRKVDSSGKVSTMAGTGNPGAPTAGPATSSNLSYPMAIAADAAGNVYIADTNNYAIEKVDTTGQLTILATASVPQGLAVDSNGTVYFSDSGNSLVRKVDTQGNLTTIAGIGTPGFSGDGGSALSANLNYPTGIAVDSAGNVYIADYNNQRIRKVDTAGDIHTIAGTGACYLSNDGPALSTALCNPFGLSYVPSTGALLFSEPYSNDRVRILYPSGTVKTIAGNGGYGFSGDGGSSYSANLAYPYGIATDASGNIYIADSNNQRIREVTGAPLSEPPTDLSITQSASSSVVAVGSNITYTLTVTNLGPGAASAITVTDNLPSSLTFVSCSSTGSGICGGSGNNRTVTFDSLPNGNSEVITLEATVGASAAGSIGNTSIVVAGTPDSNSSNNSATSSVTVGTATASLSVSSLSFGNHALNTTSAAKSFTVSNTGNADLTITSFPLSGANPGDFSVSSGTLPIDLPAGTNVLINVTFTASAMGTRAATLTVNSNAANGPQSVSLSGNGVATSTTALQSSLDPSYSGQNVTFTATVTSSGGGTPTGTVTFKDGTVKLGTGTLSGGTASFSTTSLAAGAHSISAAYSGDSNNLASNSTVLKQVVNSLPAPTTTKVVTSNSPAFVQQSVTFTASVTSGYGPIPDGETVTFYDGTTAIGATTTSGGSALFSTTSLAAGNHTIRATYAGDTNLKTSSGAVTQTVNRYLPTVTLSTNPNPTNYGQVVQLTSTVSSSAPSAPTGTVTFKVGTVVLGSAALNAGTAVLSTAKIPVGTNGITASYGGDALNSSRVSPTVLQTVNQAVTTLVLASTPNPSTAGQAVKFTITVTSNGGVPTGPVTLTNGTTTLGTVALSGGKAAFSINSLPQGTNQITATYAGSAGYAGASATLSQVVN